VTEDSPVDPGAPKPDAPGPGVPVRPFRVAFVPGVTPGRWVRAWRQRVPGIPLELLPVEEDEQRAVLDEDRADMSFVRLPVDRSGLSLIPLYREVPVVVVPREHVAAAVDEVSIAELADEYLLQPSDAVPEWRDLATSVRDGSRVEPPPMRLKHAVEAVAAGSGIVVVPMSLARLHHRRDLTYRPVTGVADTQVGLAWLEKATDERVDRFVGIVRGRTERSSRDAPASDRSQAEGRPGKTGSARAPRKSGTRGRSRRSGTARGRRR
jgi:DNA-binding transcriptional LysR family regulator